MTSDELWRRLFPYTCTIAFVLQVLIIVGYQFGPRDGSGRLFETDPEQFLWGSTAGVWLGVALVFGLVRWVERFDR